MAGGQQACSSLKTILHHSTTGPLQSLESEHLNQSRSLIPARACTPDNDTTASMYDNEPQDNTAKTVLHHVSVRRRDQTEWMATKTGPARLSQELLHDKQSGRTTPVCQPESKEAQYESRENETGTFMYDEANRRERSTVHVTQAENTDKGCSKTLRSGTLLSQEEPEISKKETVNDALVQSRRKHNCNFESKQHIQSQSAFTQKLASVTSMSGREWSQANPAKLKKARVSILPRSKVAFNMHQVDHEQTAFSQRLPSLLELQESFSKSEAHHSFNDSIMLAPVDLRDSVGVGKKHKFHGINCYYLHG